MSIEGRIREIAGQADPASRTYAVRIAMSGSPQIMRLGMTASVALQMDDEAAGVVVPLTALTESEGGPEVFVVDPTNEAVRKTPVSVGGIAEDGVRITDGLHVGEVVVTAGVQFLRDGMRVRLPDERQHARSRSSNEDCIQSLKEAVMRRETFLAPADVVPAGASKGFNLSRWAIDHGGLTAFLLVLLLAAGAFSFLRIGQKEDPDFTFRVMVVQVLWPGATVEEMQDQVVDKIERKLHYQIGGRSSTAFPMLTDTLITVAGFVPVGFAQSEAGEYVSSLFWVTGVALLISWFAAVYFTPWIGYRLLKVHDRGAGNENVFDSRPYRVIRALVTWCVHRRWLVVVLTFCALIASIASFTLIPKQFFPTSNRPEILVDLWLPEGSSFEEAEREA